MTMTTLICADGLHIMSGEWIKGQNLGDVSWSRCSKEDLERFLRYWGHLLLLGHEYLCVPASSTTLVRGMAEWSGHGLGIKVLGSNPGSPLLMVSIGTYYSTNSFLSFHVFKTRDEARWFVRLKIIAMIKMLHNIKLPLQKFSVETFSQCSSLYICCYQKPL